MDILDSAIIAGTRKHLAEVTAERDKYGRWIRDNLSRPNYGGLAAADMPRYMELETQRATISAELFALEAHAN